MEEEAYLGDHSSEISGLSQDDNQDSFQFNTLERETNTENILEDDQTLRNAFAYFGISEYEEMLLKGLPARRSSLLPDHDVSEVGVPAEPEIPVEYNTYVEEADIAEEIPEEAEIPNNNNNNQEIIPQSPKDTEKKPKPKKLKRRSYYANITTATTSTVTTSTYIPEKKENRQLSKFSPFKIKSEKSKNELKHKKSKSFTIFHMVPYQTSFEPDPEPEAEPEPEAKKVQIKSAPVRDSEFSFDSILGEIAEGTSRQSDTLEDIRNEFLKTIIDTFDSFMIADEETEILKKPIEAPIPVIEPIRQELVKPKTPKETLKKVHFEVETKDQSTEKEVKNIDRHWIRYALASNNALIPPAEALTDLEKQKKRKSLRKYCLFFYLPLLLLLGVAISILILYFNGMLQTHQSSGFTELSPILPTPLDPSQKLIIPKSIQPGQFGCSNYPSHAALSSLQYTNQTTFQSQPLNQCAKGAVRYTLTECDLLHLMQGDQNYLIQYVRRYLPHLTQAMEYFDLNCIKGSPSSNIGNRMLTFLAEIKHETNGLTQMYQSKDGGMTTLHILPIHLYQFLLDIAPVAALFQQLLPDIQISEVERIGKIYGSGLQGPDAQTWQRISTFMQRDDIVFYAGGWWFKQGAKERINPVLGCGDLRADSDLGIGNNTATGFDKVSACIFGSSDDPGSQQRERYYTDMTQYQQDKMKCQTEKCFF